MNFDFSLNTELLILVHLAVNGLVFAICLHRLRLMQKVLLRVKIQYVLLLLASFANGFSPILFRQWPSAVSVLYVSAVLFVLVSDRFQWTNGAPEAARTDRAPLERMR